MRKVIYTMSVSLDGFVETTTGDLGWSYPDAELHRHFNELERTLDVCFYGRRLYEIMASYWPTVSDDSPVAPYEKEFARIWMSKPKIVVSTTLDQVGWNARLFKGDIAAEVNRLKQQPGGDIGVGGPGLAASFMRLGLIDEFRLYQYPVLLGAGKPMFGQLPVPINLELVEARRFRRDVVLLRYQRGESTLPADAPRPS